MKPEKKQETEVPTTGEKYLVLKKFKGDRATPYEAGETVVLSGKNLQKLVDFRYITKV